MEISTSFHSAFFPHTQPHVQTSFVRLFHMFKHPMMKMTFVWRADISLIVVWLVLSLCQRWRRWLHHCWLIPSVLLYVPWKNNERALLLLFPLTHAVYSPIFLSQRKFKRDILLTWINRKQYFLSTKGLNIRETLILCNMTTFSPEYLIGETQCCCLLGEYLRNSVQSLLLAIQQSNT